MRGMKVPIHINIHRGMTEEDKEGKEVRTPITHSAESPPNKTSIRTMVRNLGGLIPSLKKKSLFLPLSIHELA